MATNTETPKAGDNSMSDFAKAMSDVFSLNTKIEGASAKLIQVMFDMDTTFHAGWFETYTKAQGKDKTAMLDKTLTELVPTYPEIVETAKFKLGEISVPTERARMAEKKADAQRKLKTATNTLRVVCNAMTFLRIGPAHTKEDGTNEYKTPCVKIEMKSGKIRFSTAKDGWFYPTFSSVSDLAKFGDNIATELGWKIVKPGTPRAGNASQAKSVQATADKAKTTNGHFNGATRELSNALISILGTAEYDKLPESDLSALRDLELALIAKVYAGKDGFIDIETLAETFEAYNDRKKDRTKQAA